MLQAASDQRDLRLNERDDRLARSRRRIGTSLLILLLCRLIVFAATLLLPGDVVEEMLGQAATPELVAAVRKSLGLDRPPLERYRRLARGLLVAATPAIRWSTRLPVAQLIGQRLPNSLMLAGFTAALAVPIALPHRHHGRHAAGLALRSRRSASLTVSMVSVPEFLIATVAVLLLAVNLRWLPALATVSDGQSTCAAAPRRSTHAGAHADLIVVAQMARLTRAAVVNTLRAPYIEMAILKGASPARVVLLHALPNAIGPIANAIALSLSSLLGGVVVVETIFNYPGLASLMVDAVVDARHARSCSPAP